MTVRPTPDQVLALAGDRRGALAAASAAEPAMWSGAGCDDSVLWGRYIGTTAEPYEVVVELGRPAFGCSCPSRRRPCKHGLGLLLAYARGTLAVVSRPALVDVWLERHTARRPAPDAHTQAGAEADAAADAAPAAAADAATDAAAGSVGGAERGAATAAPVARPADRPDRQAARDERMRTGLVEFERWLADRVRVGLAAAELADPATWEQAAARLIDAQCGGLANRVRRVASRVGRHSGWHDDVLAELALLHALMCGALRAPVLPDALADSVRSATGLTIRQADVLAGVPTTATWLVAGESRAREDRITVQRTWLIARDQSTRGSTWAMLLSFGAVGRELSSPWPVGTEFEGDVHWYPGTSPLRALVGVVHRPAQCSGSAPRGGGVAEALAEVGRQVAAEPWIERVPVCLRAAPVPHGDGRWSLVDDDGAVAIVPGFARLAELVASSGGAPVTVVGEWSPDGVLPLTVWVDSGGGTSRAVVL